MSFCCFSFIYGNKVSIIQEVDKVQNMDGLILAGGKSTRMGGSHKGFLELNRETFMERLICEMQKCSDQVWISYGAKVHAEYAGCKLVTDEYLDCGPIGGIHAGLKKCESKELAVAACDMPFLRAEFFQHLNGQLQDHDAIVPVIDGKLHPLAAIYKKTIIPILEEQIRDKNYKLKDALQKMDIVYVDVSGQEEYRKMLRNINTIEDYKEIQR